MSKILYITNDGLTDPLGGSQVIPYLERLSHHHKIHVLACEKLTAYKKNHAFIENILKKPGIVWHVVKYRNRPPVLSSWLMQREVKKFAGNIIKRNNIDLLHCRSYPASVTGLSLSKKYSIPFIFDMRGFWADERIDRHIWNKRNPVFYLLYRYFKIKERELLQRASHIITLTYKAKLILENDFALRGEKITVIPCASDLAFFRKPGYDVVLQYRQKLALQPGDKLLLYMGSVGSCYLVDEMLRFYKHGKEHIPGLKMAFFSPPIHHAEITALAKKHGIDKNELICRFIPRRELPGFLSAVDYSVMFFENSFSIKGSSPTKHGELLGMHIPVVVNAGVGDLEEIVNEKNTGIVINNFSQEEFEKAWRHLLNSPFNPGEFDEVAGKYYSLEKGVKDILAIYRKTITST